MKSAKQYDYKRNHPERIRGPKAALAFNYDSLMDAKVAKSRADEIERNQAYEAALLRYSQEDQERFERIKAQTSRPINLARVRKILDQSPHLTLAKAKEMAQFGE